MDPQFRSHSSDSNELSGMQLLVRVEDLGRGGRAAAAVGDGRSGFAAKEAGERRGVTVAAGIAASAGRATSTM